MRACKILDTVELESTGEVTLDIKKTSTKRTFGAGNIFTEVLNVVKEKIENGTPVMVFLKEMQECGKLEKKLAPALKLEEQLFFSFDAESM